MIITQTPLRISFLGGGTDYPEYFLKHSGAVLGTAVDKSAVFCMSRFYSKLFDYSIRIAYRQVECVNAIDEIKHSPFRECLRWAGLTKDFEVNHAGGAALGVPNTTAIWCFSARRTARATQSRS